MLKLYELKNKRKELLDAAQTALEKKDMEVYNAKMAEAKALNGEISALEELDAERGRFDESNTGMVNLHAAIEKKKEDVAKKNRLDSARSGNDYTNAFAAAMRNRAAVDTNMGNEAYKPLYNAMTITGGTPEGSEGGFLVPIEFDNMIHTVMKEFIRLADYFNIENVTGYTGWRAVETSASRAPLPVIDEAQELPKDQKPKFKKVVYNIKKYGDRIAISNELLADNTAGLMQYLAQWFGPRVVLTENAILLKLMEGLAKKTLTPNKEISELKTALNKGLNTAISRNAILLANQSSYDFLDRLTDTTGRGLLVPNPADPDVYRFKNRKVICADDDLIPNRNVASGEGAGEYSPLFIGYFKAFGTLFRRQAFEFATTNIGGDSWATATSEARGIVRMDAQLVDDKAAIKREVFISSASEPTE